MHTCTMHAWRPCLTRREYWPRASTITMQFPASTTNAPSLRSTGVWGKRRGIDDLLAKLSSNSPDFKSLVIISTRNIDNDSATQLVDILIQENDTLTELYASGHYLDSNEYPAFYKKLLKYNKTIQTLSIGDKTSEKLYLLCEGLIHNSGLQTIDLEYKGLDATKNALCFQT